MKRILTGIVLLALVSGCAVTTAQVSVSRNVEVYKIGQFTIRIYDNPEMLMADLKRLKLPLFDPELLPGITIVGNHDKKTLTVYSIRDVYILMHELKHLLEPDWTHAIPCGRTSCIEETRK